jgi:hypothetical protein
LGVDSPKPSAGLGDSHPKKRKTPEGLGADATKSTGFWVWRNQWPGGFLPAVESALDGRENFSQPLRVYNLNGQEKPCEIGSHRFHNNFTHYIINQLPLKYLTLLIFPLLLAQLASSSYCAR